ncbi:MAG: hypothetical protein WC812_03800 [Candidatus Pacearchaeota archaeon]|jgi:hypothetical protein
MKISSKKKDKILEQILAYLFSQNPKPIFTAYIALEIARDEEFTKKLLLELKQKNLISEIKKNPSGRDYLKRARWKLTEEAYVLYKNIQEVKK